MERSPPKEVRYFLARCLSGGGRLCSECEGKILAHKRRKSANMFLGASRVTYPIR